MRRFIFVTFIFLGWAFYLASGGADYAPRPGSLQARVSEDVTPPVRELSGLVTPADESTVTALADLDLSKSRDTEVTLASASTEGEDVATASDPIEDTGTDLEKVAILTLDSGYADITIAEPLTVPEVTQPRDIREVTGNVVNMRDGPGTSFERVGKITKGTEIVVLEDPGNSWVKLQVLDTGETGWIADWLITAAN